MASDKKSESLTKQKPESIKKKDDVTKKEGVKQTDEKPANLSEMLRQLPIEADLARTIEAATGKKYKDAIELLRQVLTKPSLTGTIEKSDGKVLYDLYLKSVFSFKIVLAYLVKAIIPEFKDYSEKEIAENYIHDMVVENPDAAGGKHTKEQTDKQTEKQTSEKTETKTSEKITLIENRKLQYFEISESVPDAGTTSRDLLFMVQLPEDPEDKDKPADSSSEEKQEDLIIINLEPQADCYPGYSIDARQEFYAARIFSRQNILNGGKIDYNKIRHVYVIFLMVDPPKKLQNTGQIIEFKQREFIDPNKEPGEFHGFQHLVKIHTGDPDQPGIPLFLRLIDIIVTRKITGSEKLKVCDVFLTEKVRHGVQAP